MGSWYFKNEEGRYFPVEFKIKDPGQWDNKLIVVKVGNNDAEPNYYDLEEIVDNFMEADVILNVENASFFITRFDMTFEESGISNGKMYIAYDRE